jgi:Methyltransferase small domain
VIWPYCKQAVKRWLYAVAPDWTTAYNSARDRDQHHRAIKNWGLDTLNAKLLDQFGSTVLEGPFAGLILTPMTCAEQLGPYLLGVYESELDEAWQTVMAGRYAQIVDVGCKFGYYAVGLAKRYPQAAVVAFDSDWWARKAIAEMAAANAALNVNVKRFCDATWLTRNLVEGAFIISDCEGFEAKLFADPALVQSAVLLIETHDCFVPGTTAALQGAFAATHAVYAVEVATERRESTRNLEFLTPTERDFANREIRGPQTWLLCLPKTGPNAVLAFSSTRHLEERTQFARS